MKEGWLQLSLVWVNAIIKYELKLHHEGKDDGNDDAANELVIDEDLIADGGEDSFFDFDNFDESDYENEYAI